MRPTAYSVPPITYAPGLAIHSTPVDAFLKNLLAWAPGFVRCFASRSSKGNITTVPTAKDAPMTKSFVVNSGAGVFALSALAFGGRAGCAPMAEATADSPTVTAVTRVV